MATALETSPTKYAPPDWHVSNEIIQSSAERQREATHRIRQESTTTRNETNITTKWTQHHTDTSLYQRINNISDWKTSLQKTLSETENAITLLTTSKRLAECALAAKEMPVNVVLECLATRERRVAIDLVRDEVESELNKEMSVLEGIQVILHQRIGQAFGQLCQLNKCHQNLLADINDKGSALSIDNDCMSLGNTSNNIALQIDPTRIKKGIVNPIQWEAYSTHNTEDATKEIGQSARLREAISHTIQQTTNDLESQWTATNYALRKRIHEVKQAHQELDWQRKKTEAEISEVEKEIESLTISLMEKTPPMKVAHTRLENRTQRPNVELCRDKPQYGLVEEITEITSSQKQLAEKLHLAKQSLGTLQRTLKRIMTDLSVKINSLELDNHCLAVREQLSGHPKPHELPQLIAQQDNQQTEDGK